MKSGNAGCASRPDGDVRYFWQRVTAAPMAPMALVHRAVIFHAPRKARSRGAPAADGR